MVMGVLQAPISNEVKYVNYMYTDCDKQLIVPFRYMTKIPAMQ